MIELDIVREFVLQAKRKGAKLRLFQKTIDFI